MNWFEALTGIREDSADEVRRNLVLDGDCIRSSANGRQWKCGSLQTPSLAELRERAEPSVDAGKPTTIRELVADVQSLHADPANADALFQVASQFNLLEMASPRMTPEDGLGIYEHDYTQGPACAIAAGAGTIYRNYFAPVNGQVGQTANNQIDCLAELGEQLGNRQQQLWRMVNGYALPSRNGLVSINAALVQMDETERDGLRSKLRIGLQTGVQVTLNESSHTVNQAYCSALPVAYGGHEVALWRPFAKLILEAAYEATLLAAIESAARGGATRLFLTLLGGGAFGNETTWILHAIARAFRLYRSSGLEISIVSYGRSKPDVFQLADSLNAAR